MGSHLSCHIIPISALKDNYIWALCDPVTKKAWVVDPGEAKPVITLLSEQHYQLAGILITHHHFDHTGGIQDLLDYAGNLPVVGSSQSPIRTINHPVKEGDHVQCLSFDFNVIAIPGHTLDHTAYYDERALMHPTLFTGDTLFSAGCGKIFEGTPDMMYASLNKLTQLRDDTDIYCGHEYTLANLRFAKTVEPHNEAIQRHLHEIQGCSLPSTLHNEKKWNPFLRCDVVEVRQAAEKYAGKTLTQSIEVFAYLRKWKNG